jgi:high-affinity Fe2+/Pb2+ permease
VSDASGSERREAARRASEQRSPETPEEELNRNLSELLQELRVAQMGVQVLFAFLLTVPFSQRFGEVTGFQRDVYFATLLSATVSAILLIAPTAQHRLLFGRHDKRYLVTAANRLAIAGLAFLAIAMTAVVLLLTDVLFGAATTVGVAVAVGLTFAVLWFLIPLRRRERLPPPPRDEVEPPPPGR